MKIGNEGKLGKKFPKIDSKLGKMKEFGLRMTKNGKKTPKMGKTDQK